MGILRFSCISKNVNNNSNYVRYLHTQQPALNYNIITLNGKNIQRYSPYCSECFKTNVLLLNHSKEKVIDNSIEDLIDIIYL